MSAANAGALSRRSTEAMSEGRPDSRSSSIPGADMVLAPFLWRTFPWDVGGSQVAAVSRGAGPSGPLPQQRGAAAAVIAPFAHQQVQREHPPSVSHPIELRAPPPPA